MQVFGENKNSKVFLLSYKWLLVLMQMKNSQLLNYIMKMIYYLRPHHEKCKCK